MMRKAKIIMGLALALTAILVTIDHIHHRSPGPAVAQDAKANATTIEPARALDDAPREPDTKRAAPGY